MIKLLFPLKFLEFIYNQLSSFGFIYRNRKLEETLDKLKAYEFFKSNIMTADALYFSQSLILTSIIIVFIVIFLLIISNFLPDKINKTYLFLFILSLPPFFAPFIYKKLTEKPFNILQTISEIIMSEMFLFVQELLNYVNKYKPEIAVVIVLKEKKHVIPNTYNFYSEIIETSPSKAMETMIIDILISKSPSDEVAYVFKKIKEAIDTGQDPSDSLKKLWEELSFYYKKNVENVIKEVEGKRNGLVLALAFPTFIGSAVPLVKMFFSIPPFSIIILYFLTGLGIFFWFKTSERKIRKLI